MMGDHYAFGKGGYFDGSQHIPLVIRDPRSSARGKRVTAFTEAVDVFPTLLEVIGGEPLHRPDGRSLTPLLGGEAPADWRDEAHWEFDFRDVEGQTAERWFNRSSTELNLAVVRTKRWKYVHFAALPSLLFDLEADPGELNNLAADPGYAAVRLEMAERLLSWRAQHLDQTLALTELTEQGVVKAPPLR
jgi:arylsulfatase A-like enzyme